MDNLDWASLLQVRQDGILSLIIDIVFPAAVTGGCQPTIPPAWDLGGLPTGVEGA